MEASLYLPIYLGITTTLAYLYGFRYISSNGFILQVQKTNFIFPLLISIFFVLWIGNRPINGQYFGDTANYALSYSQTLLDSKAQFDLKTEWIWQFIMISCKQLGFNIHVFFIIIEAGYIFSALWAVKKFMPTNPMLGMLFVFTSLMFFTFGTNGLRNGLACHLLLLGMAFIFESNIIVGILLSFIAFGIHRSVMLPVVAMATGIFLVRNYKLVIGFWFFSIFLSLALGNSIANFFGSLGFDDRMNAYNTSEYALAFSHTGFRWDFLLYSFFPILMAWWVLIKQGIKDRWYEVLCITYTLSNAFWVMVIGAAFSNRFAYLSWFLYPIVIAYPLINLPVWENQDKKTGILLLLYSSFTLFMEGFYW